MIASYVCDYGALGLGKTSQFRILYQVERMLVVGFVGDVISDIV